MSSLDAGVVTGKSGFATGVVTGGFGDVGFTGLATVASTTGAAVGFGVAGDAGALAAAASFSRRRSRSACSSALKNWLMIPTNG
jgi:hypothetical protein